mgnify:CR=1 FL=1
MENINDYSKKQADMCIDNDSIPKALYTDYGVKKGLRDENGQGVLTGLTNISSVRAFDVIDGEKVPCDGELLYRGYDVTKLVKGAGDKRFIFEESAYLLLFGELPDATQLEEFRHIIANCMELPTNFTRDVIMKAPSADIMNSMTRSILTLASYDDRKDDLSIENVLRQSIQLISTFPMLAVYGYHAYNHYERDDSMYIHRPDKELSLAENFLRMLRPDMKYTPLETHVLDIALLLHMEHGGGNNSSFTTRVVTSSGSDTYSAIAAAMSSLKGRKHGGANLMVMNMMEDIRAHIKDYHDEEEIEHYLDKILNKEAFDKMKTSAVLLNLGRGPIVNDADLTEALEQGKIAAAGLDVLGKEPIEKDNPLLRIKDSTKLVITPHVAWGTVEARTRLMDEVYENIAAFTKGEARNAVV